MDRGRRKGVSVSRGMLPLLALHAVTEYSRLERKPPVTAGLVAANTIIYLRPKFLDRIIPYIDEVWFNPHLILKYKDLKRFFLSAFYHINEPHLVYNMLSLLWKGIVRVKKQEQRESKQQAVFRNQKKGNESKQGIL